MESSVKLTKSTRFAPQSGFTLVELLVVMAIVGVLMGLLLPAVQAAREAARRTACVNNLSQLAIAMHHHDFNVEHLPSGTINPDGPIRSEPIGKHISWTVQILPFIEQRNLHDRFDFDAGAYAAANSEVRAAFVSTFLCPSHPVTGPKTGSMQIAGIAAESHYAGCHHDAEMPIADDNSGLLFLNSKIRFADITDGSSQTILLGEIKVDSSHLGWVSGTRSTLRNVGNFGKSFENNNTQSSPILERPMATGPLDVGSFDCFHPGGFNAVIADGAVRFLSENTDQAVMQQLANRADGQVFSNDPF